MKNSDRQIAAEAARAAGAAGHVELVAEVISMAG